MDGQLTEGERKLSSAQKSKRYQSKTNKKKTMKVRKTNTETNRRAETEEHGRRGERKTSGNTRNDIKFIQTLHKQHGSTFNK